MVIMHRCVIYKIQIMQPYPEIYQGGYNHVVDDATKAALIAGGVGVTESNFTAL
jgi:hypothetical protein